MASAHNKSFNFEKIVKLRHWLHAHPEMPGKEKETSDYIIDYLLDNCAPDELVPLAGTGFAVVYKGRRSGRTILIRAELDALPIQETNENLTYKSLHNGIAHKCGHDGHMAIVAGIAQIYARHRPESGRIVLLFQSSKETGTGARDCCTHDNFKKIEPDYAFTLQNVPGFPKHQIICRADAAEMIQKVAIENGLHCSITDMSFPGDEDFSHITKRYKGALFGLGAGEDCSALYAPDYDFPDEILLTGVIMFKKLIDQILHPETQKSKRAAENQKKAA